MERGWKPNFEICPPCPRCGSSNTKFCYYNNYSLTQPRYFCKGCRRYWTKGGSLRNIPVGGGCRKTRRAKVVRVADTANARNILAHGGGNVENQGGDGGVGLIGLPTNIDLQQVYANFLKQGSKVTHQEQMHDQVLPSEVDPMTSFGSGRIPNIDMEFGGVNYGSNLESFQTEGGGIQFFGYNSIFNNDYGEKHYFVTNSIFDCGLLPLPGEELGWSESHIGLLESVFDPSIKPKHHVSPYCSAKLFEQMLNIDTM